MRIPTGNFGQTVARAQPIQTASAQELDGGLGRSVANVGAAGEQLAGQMQANAAYDAEMARRQASAEAREQAQARAAADKAQAQARLGVARDALDDLHETFADGIATGQIDKTKAAELWQKQSTAAVTAGLDGVPADHLATVQNDLNARAARLGNKVGHAVMLRDRTDTLAGIDQTLEYAQRLSTSDPAKGRQIGVEAIEQLGPFADLSADQIGKKKQTFLEGVSYTRAYTAVTTARDDNATLRKVDSIIAADADLDPQKKAQLLNTSAGFQAHNDQRTEMAAQRAQRVAEANLKRAEAAFNVFQATADKGGALDPAYVEQVSRATAGTPYQAGVVNLARQAVETGGVAAQPIATQRAALEQIDLQIQKTGRTPELDRRRSQIEKVYTASQKDAQADALHAGLERGVITSIEPVDMSSPQAISTSIAKRVVQAQQVGSWVGRPVSPLTTDEATALQTTLEKLPPPQRAQGIATLAKAMGLQQSAALAAQLDDKNRPLALAFAAGSSGTTKDRLVSELILRGDQAQKDGTSTKGEKTPGVKSATWKANLSAQLEGAFPDQQTGNQMRDTALLVTHAIAAEQGGALSQSDIERAVHMTIGGTIEEHNGRKVPVPMGIGADGLERRLKSITSDELRPQAGGNTVRAGGVDVPLEQFTKSLPGAQLIAVKPGRYAVLVNERPVTGAKGRPIIVGF